MTRSDNAFATYLASLIASWEALAAPRTTATVVRGGDFAAARFAEPYLNNAVILAPSAVEPAAQIYDAHETYALWCLDDDRPTAAALTDHGYVHSEVTTPMLRRLDDSLDVEQHPAERVIADADREWFAEFIGVSGHLLRDVADLRVFASAGFESGLVLQHLSTDVYVSMVYTTPDARGRGLATAVLTTALLDARRRGALTATLQSTPMAVNLYSRNGFQPVGRWQEWVLRS